LPYWGDGWPYCDGCWPYCGAWRGCTGSSGGNGGGALLAARRLSSVRWALSWALFFDKSCDMADWLREDAASGARRAEPKEPNDELPLRAGAAELPLLAGLLFCDENPPL
jgi:hypothetical protein